MVNVVQCGQMQSDAFWKGESKKRLLIQVVG